MRQREYYMCLWIYFGKIKGWIILFCFRSEIYEELSLIISCASNIKGDVKTIVAFKEVFGNLNCLILFFMDALRNNASGYKQSLQIESLLIIFPGRYLPFSGTNHGPQKQHSSISSIRISQHHSKTLPHLISDPALLSRPDFTMNLSLNILVCSMWHPSLHGAPGRTFLWDHPYNATSVLQLLKRSLFPGNWSCTSTHVQ